MGACVRVRTPSADIISHSISSARSSSPDPILTSLERVRLGIDAKGRLYIAARTALAVGVVGIVDMRRELMLRQLKLVVRMRIVDDFGGRADLGGGGHDEGRVRIGRRLAVRALAHYDVLRYPAHRPVPRGVGVGG